MSEMFLSERFQCGDAAGLISYLYDECEPDERKVIAAHVSACVTCAEELSSLRATRTQLASWTPPEAAIGFRITTTARVNETASAPESEPETGRVLRPARWWSRPLPAWAQIAAGLLLFASGMAIGVTRPGASGETAAVKTPAAPIVQPVAAISPEAGVSPSDLQDLERRLRGEIAQLRTANAAAPAPRTDSEVLKRVQTLITDSEERQRRELALRTTEIVRDMDTQRRVDMAQVSRNIGQIQDLTGAAVRDQNDMFNYLVKVSQRAR
jgi:anti-sigma factor RsiW